MEVGNNSVRDICIMIPAISENNKPRIVSFINLLKKRYVIIAPIGSEAADTNVYRKAFSLLFVE